MDQGRIIYTPLLALCLVWPPLELYLGHISSQLQIYRLMNSCVILCGTDLSCWYSVKKFFSHEDPANSSFSIVFCGAFHMLVLPSEACAQQVSLVLCRNYLQVQSRDGTSHGISHGRLLQCQLWMRPEAHLLPERRAWEGMPERPMFLPGVQLQLCRANRRPPWTLRLPAQVAVYHHQILRRC